MSGNIDAQVRYMLYVAWLLRVYHPFMASTRAAISRFRCDIADTHILYIDLRGGLYF